MADPSETEGITDLGRRARTFHKKDRKKYEKENSYE